VTCFSAQVEAAIAHYIEAGAAIEAINAALAARQYNRAAQLVQDTLHDAESARPFWRKLAAVYAARGALEDAEKMFLKVRHRGAPVQCANDMVSRGATQCVVFGTRALVLASGW
jgi:Tfp pilus assembly protein PilF